MRNLRTFFFYIALLSAWFYIIPNAMGQSFSDDFITDTTAEYTVTNVWTSGGFGQFLYDASGKRARVQTGDDISLRFSHALPASDSGTFSVDFLPTAKFPSGGWVVIRLVQDTSNYYEVINQDGYGAGYIRKVVDGVEVSVTDFQSEYTQNNTYTVLINFSPASTQVDAFGEVLNISGDSNAIAISSFDVEIGQQHAYFDNIYYNIN